MRAITNRLFKILCVFGIIFLVVALSFAYLLWGWTLRPELAAKCDNGVTIWRRNPGAWSSYRYEVRGGDKTSGIYLTFSQLDDYVDAGSCLFLGGG